MNKRQAEICKGIIEVELNKACDKYDVSSKKILGDSLFHPMERMFNVTVRESPHSKGWFGVDVATDSDVYDLFYEFSDGASKLQKDIVKKIEQRLGSKFKGEHHYFEHYGGGIIQLY